MAAEQKSLVDDILGKIAYVARKRKPVEEDWAENLRWMNGDFTGGEPEVVRDRVDVNLFWSLGRAIVPGVYFRDPDILVEPENPIGIERAPLLQAILRYRFRKMGVKKVIQKMIMDGLPHHKGFCKVGYVMETFRTEAETDPVTGEVTAVTDASTYHDLAEHQIEKMETQVGSHPVIHRVSPRALYADAMSTEIADAMWMAEEIVMHVDDLQADDRYDAADVRPNFCPTEGMDGGIDALSSAYDIESRGTSSASGLGPYGDPNEPSPDGSQLVRMYEFWDRRTRRVITVVPGHPEPIRDIPWPYPRFPYFELCLTLEVPDEPYPMPVLTAVKPQQVEINEIRSYQLDYIKRAITKYAVDTSIVDQPGRDALARADGLPVIPVSGDATKAIHVIQGAAMNPEVHVAEQTIRRDVSEISGVAEFQRGNATPRGTTATEQRLMAQSSSMSIEMMIDKTQDLVVEIANFVADLDMQYAEKEQILRITGDSGVEWKRWTKSDIQGDYEISIHAGTQLHVDQAMRAKQALDRFNLLAPIALQGGPVKFGPLLKDTLEATGAKNISQYIDDTKLDRPPQDPWMEEELLKIGGKPSISSNDEDDEHIAIHMQEAERETDDFNLYRRMIHIRDHQVQKVRKQQMMMAQLAGMGGPMGGPGMGAPQPPNPMGQSPMGRVNSGGMGRQTPKPGQPANPRQMSERNPNIDGVFRAASTQEAT